jgi:Ca-activated chloride channel family protein
VTLLATLLLMPAAVSAHETIVPIELVPPRPCDGDCWWPVGSVAQLDTMEAEIEVSDGAMIARYHFDLSNPLLAFEDRPRVGAEGRIVFPVPPGSAVTDLLLSGGPETLEGRLLDAEEAARIYEDIVRRLIDPALLRSLGDDLYEVRAFPVPAGEQRQVSFTVTTSLLADGEQALVEVPWSRMSPRPTSASVAVSVDVPWEVRSALAPGFALDTERVSSGELDVSWESTDAWTPDANFRLYLGGGEGLVDTRLLTNRVAGEDGYFALLFAPVVEVDTVIPRDVVLILDTSGSMEGEKIEQAISAVEYVLENLGDQDRFGIVRFSRYVRAFRRELSPASDAGAGIAWVRELAAGGNTNISGALARGLDFLDGKRPGTIIFLTDGLPTAGIEDRGGILQMAELTAPERTQLFAFGVGYDVDTVLLDSLSTRFVGTSHYVTPDERIDTEVQNLYERVSTPVLTDVQIKIDGVKTWDLSPEGIAGIFAGTQSLLTGRYDGSGDATVVVSGNSVLGPESFTYDVGFPEVDGTDPTVSQLWAQRRIADLLTEIRIEGTRESLIEQIVDIANRFGIVTPYTAYLAEEPDLAFDRDEGRNRLNDALDAVLSNGESAVAGASALEALREGEYFLGGLDKDGRQTARVLGAHSYYRLGDGWARDGYDPATDAPEVLVGSSAFAELIEAAPELVAAVALGERVTVLGPDGWVTIVWPDADDVVTPSVIPNLPPSSMTSAPRDAGE